MERKSAYWTGRKIKNVRITTFFVFTRKYAKFVFTIHKSINYKIIDLEE